MASILLSNVPPELAQALDCRAQEAGRTTEAEVLALLAAALDPATTSAPSVEQRVARLQAVFQPYRSKSGSIVDELIADRRAEVRAEQDGPGPA